jgi:predicted Zn-dependent peptidase
MHMRFWGATLARNLPAALDLYADILRRPQLPEQDLDAVKALALQDLQSLEDEPQYKAMVELRRRFFPPPLGRDRRGTPEGVASLTIDQVRQQHYAMFRPQGTILAVAGHIEWKTLRNQVERLFGDWTGATETELHLGTPPGGRHHIPKETAQTHIAIAYPSVPFGHPEYYAAQGAVNILSGGFSSRLFTEIREKHGLCYAISASYLTFKGCAGICCYAGTTNQRAQKTLDLTLAELVRLQEGVTKEEVERVQAGLKSSLIMQEESTSARAGALASDWFYLGRVRGLDEIQAAIDGLTPRKIVAHLRRHPPRDFSLVAIGPKPLKFRLPRPADATPAAAAR